MKRTVLFCELFYEVFAVNDYCFFCNSLSIIWWYSFLSLISSAFLSPAFASSYCSIWFVVLYMCPYVLWETAACAETGYFWVTEGGKGCCSWPGVLPFANELTAFNKFEFELTINMLLGYCISPGFACFEINGFWDMEVDGILLSALWLSRLRCLLPFSG